MAVWRGANTSDFERVLTALHDAEVPLLFREHLNVRSAVQASLHNVFVPFRRSKSVFDTEFEVKVLERDAGRARQAIQDALDGTADEGD